MISTDLTSYVHRFRIQSGLIEICLAVVSFGSAASNDVTDTMRHGDYYHPCSNGQGVTLYLKFTCPRDNGKASVEILKNGEVNHRELSLRREIQKWSEHKYTNISVRIDPKLAQYSVEAINGQHRGESIITQVTIYKNRGAVISSF